MRSSTQTTRLIKSLFFLSIIFTTTYAFSTINSRLLTSSSLHRQTIPTTTTTISSSSSSTSTSLCIMSASSAPKEEYDLLIIGGGAAGLTAAKFASTFSKSVAIIEKSKYGGDCTWTGCVPSKTLIASSKVSYTVSNSDSFGIVSDNGGGGDVGSSSSSSRVDLSKIKQRLDRNRNVIYKEDDSPEALEKLNIDSIVGCASFVSPNVLKVTTTLEEEEEGEEKVMEVKAKYGIMIGTGAKPNKMGGSSMIQGLDTIEYWTYENIFEMEELPNRLTVVGGGPIGCELSQALSRLGVDVTLVANELLTKEEPEISSALLQVFEKEGINVIAGKVTSVEPLSSSSSEKTSKHVATISKNDGTATTVEGDVMLVAVGRKPVVDGMGLKELGVKLNEKTGGIEVDKNLRTSVKGVYAAGDCTGGAQFTHYAGYQGAVAARNILLPFSDPGVLENVPASTFTNPEIASVGMTEAEAREKYGAEAVSVAIQQVKETDRAICEDQTDGVIKIVYKTKNYKILGASIMSTAASEMISEIGVAMKTNLSFDMLATVMHTYPSYSVALQLMAGEVYYSKLKKNIGLYNFLKKLGL